MEATMIGFIGLLQGSLQFGNRSSNSSSQDRSRTASLIPNQVSLAMQQKQKQAGPKP